jgi:threonine dehydrogenase-like Zn-dependent dehydrogenase
MHGFMTEYIIEEERYLWRVPRELRDVAVLIEPLTIAEKVFFEFQAIDTRLPWRKERRRAVVLGAGPVGLLGAMMFRAAEFDTWVYSRSRAPNAKAAIAEAIGARYVSSLEVPPREFARGVGSIDVVYEAMGAPQTALDVLQCLGPNGVFIFTGVPAADAALSLELHRLLLHMIVRNQVIVGTVNAGADAFDAAIRDLAVFHARWRDAVRSMITARFGIEDFRSAIEGSGIKNVIEMCT